MDDERDANATALHAYYELDKERDRLARGVGRVEFTRTVELIERTLPAAPGVVADIGGGPGRYTDWLVGAGYTVLHRDLVPHHVEQVRRRHGPAVDAEVADACALDIGDRQADAVLLLGPLYHLEHRHQRVTALREAARIVRPGGRVFAAAISRWATRLHGMLTQRTYRLFPSIIELVAEVERTGWLPPLFDGSFTGYSHRPGGLRDEIAEAGLELDALVNVEGPAGIMSDADLDARMDDPEERAILLDSLRAVEHIPELLGTGPHLLATATVPA